MLNAQSNHGSTPMLCLNTPMYYSALGAKAASWYHEKKDKYARRPGQHRHSAELAAVTEFLTKILKYIYFGKWHLSINGAGKTKYLPYYLSLSGNETQSVSLTLHKHKFEINHGL